MNKIALTMICKNEDFELDRCLSSVYPFVDGIFILITGDNPRTEEIAKKYKAVIKKDTSALHTFTKDQVDWLNKFFGWDVHSKVDDTVFIFDEARNKALDMVPKDFKYVLWIDADDFFRGGDKLRAVCDLMDQNQATAMFMNYLYDVEVDEKTGQIKNVMIEHLRERIILNDGRYKWVAPIHETLISQTGEIRQMENRDCDVVHLSPRSKKEQAIMRNIKVLEYSIYRTEGKDPRPIYYLAKAFYDLHTEDYYVKAEKLIYRYLKSSGWAEERAQAYEYLAEMFRERKEYNKAIKAAMNAIIECPKFPTTYLSLGLTYLIQGNLDYAQFYVQMAAKIPMPKTTLVIQPRDMVTRALEIMYNVSLKSNKLDEAWASITKLKEIFPNDANIEKNYQMAASFRRQREITKMYVELVKVLQLEGDKNRLIAMANAAPREIEGNPIVSEFVKEIKPSKVWPKGSVVIYCGPGFTAWSPKFLKKQAGTFVGGSEEAVIYAARELVKQGFDVTVYGDPGNEGVYDKVRYLNHFKMNLKDEFDIFIGWRSVQFFDHKFNARKTYLWLHDVPNSIDYTKARLDSITKIMVLSKAQRELLPMVDESRFFYTTNGFVEEHPNIKPSNNQYTCIWTSSYDRGLQHLLEIWPDVKKAVPQAKLRIFYGWQLFDRFYYNNPERQLWKKKIEDMMKYSGIFHGGRIEQGEIEKEYKKAGILAYPTDFFEISYISGIKAQAFGAVPVVMNYAALKETIQFGVKVEGDIWDKDVKETYKKALVEALKTKWVRVPMMKWAKDKYTWASVIRNWREEMK